MALLKVHKNEKQKIMNIDNLDEPILHISISSRFISNVKFDDGGGKKLSGNQHFLNVKLSEKR